MTHLEDRFRYRYSRLLAAILMLWITGFAGSPPAIAVDMPWPPTVHPALSFAVLSFADVNHSSADDTVVERAHGALKQDRIPMLSWNRFLLHNVQSNGAGAATVQSNATRSPESAAGINGDRTGVAVASTGPAALPRNHGPAAEPPADHVDREAGHNADKTDADSAALAASIMLLLAAVLLGLARRLRRLETCR